MIYQSDFITDDINASELYSGLGVKLHGAAMKLIKSSYAEFLHQKEHHPFSIFAVPNDGGFVIRVSARVLSKASGKRSGSKSTALNSRCVS